MAGLRDLSHHRHAAGAPARGARPSSRRGTTRDCREACQRELARGGQVYFLHNDVETIEQHRARARRARARGAHRASPTARCRERELEQVMLDFHHQRFNVLVCTTIIEIAASTSRTPTRSSSTAPTASASRSCTSCAAASAARTIAPTPTWSCPTSARITADAAKRLEAIASLEELGAGFTLATHDLEIRGAGELLGEDQSGQIAEIGFSLYTELLERAVRSAQARQAARPRHAACTTGAEVELHVPALIPDDYLPDVHARLTLYKRIASARDADELRELQVEMIDRFGLLPDPAKNLFGIAELKLGARALGIRKLDVGPGGGSVTFERDTRVEPATLIRYVQQNSRTHRLEGGTKLRFTLKLEKDEQRFAAVEQLLEALQKPAAATLRR